MSTEEVLNALDAVRIAATRVALRDFPAPKPVATNAKAWWRRAYAYALRECRKGREDRWANAIRLLRMRRAYIPLYARAVAPPADRPVLATCAEAVFVRGKVCRDRPLF